MKAKIDLMKLSMLIGMIIYSSGCLLATNAPITTIDSVKSCLNSNVSFTIKVTNFNGVSSASLTLLYDPAVMTFNASGTSLNPAFTMQIYHSSPLGGSSLLNQLRIAMFNVSSAISLADGSILGTLSFNYISGASALSFDNTVDLGHSCEYSDLSGSPFTDVPTQNYYHDGSVTALLNPILSLLPISSICMDTVSFVLSNGSPLGGSYSGPGILNNVLYPSIAGSGIHQYTFTYQNSAGCSSSLSGQFQVKQKSRVSGTVRYDNIAGTQIDSVKIKIIKTPGLLVDSALNNSSGDYSIACISSGNYSLSPDCSKKWKGVNATDALIMLKHSVHLLVLSPFKRTVGDVNSSGIINATNAFLVMRRFVGYIDHFSVPDWIFQSPTSLSISDSNSINEDLLVACAGDVDGSYPGSYKKQSFQEIQEILITENDNTVSLPVTLHCTKEIAAISLKLFMPSSLSLLKLTSGIEDSYLNKTDESVNFGWFSLMPLQQNDKLELFRLTIDTKEVLRFQELIKNLESEVEIADFNGNRIDDFSLSIPKVVFSNPLTIITKSLILNSEMESIDVTSSQAGFLDIRLFDQSGQKIGTIVNEYTLSGHHHFSFSQTGIKAGMYFIRGSLRTENNCWERNCKVIFL